VIVAPAGAWAQTAAVRRLDVVADEIDACRACPRLVAHMADVAVTRRRAFAAETYHARPLPGWGDPRARIALVGLAPAAHGGTRTGRVFTGDASGAFLCAALHRAGLASQPTSTHRDDGLRLRDVFITLAARCAPPANRPTPDELARCRPFLAAELAALPRLAVAVALGRIAWDAVCRLHPAPRPAFAHGARARLGGLLLLGSYHPSQQNTNTGRLVPAMLDAVLTDALAAAGATG
jgi:uracil-DNA glycosylase family 4